MKWTRKRLLDYIAKGHKIYLTSEYSVNDKLREKLGIVVTNIYHLRYINGVDYARPTLLTEELFAALPDYSKKRMLRNLNYHLPCFEAIYKDRLLDYRRSRDALATENGN